MKNGYVFAYRIGVAFLTVLFFALTFVPCIRMVSFNGWTMEESVSYINCGPAFYGVVSFFELLLVFCSQKMWAKIIRVILSLVKAVAPLLSIVILNKLGVLFSDLFISYTYNSFIYIITGLGIVLVIIHFAALFCQPRISRQE